MRPVDTIGSGRSNDESSWQTGMRRAQLSTVQKQRARESSGNRHAQTRADMSQIVGNDEMSGVSSSFLQPLTSSQYSPSQASWTHPHCRGSSLAPHEML
jgi:hypothetical protein